MSYYPSGDEGGSYGSYDHDAYDDDLDFGRGVAHSLLIVPLMVLAWLAVWQLGVITSIVALGGAVGAVLFYRYGSRGTMSGRGVVAILVVLAVSLVLSLAACFVMDAYTNYPLASATGNVLQQAATVVGDTGFWEWIGRFWMSSSTTWEAWIPTIAIAALFTAVGAIPTLRLAYLGAEDRLAVSTAVSTAAIVLAIAGALTFVLGPPRIDLAETAEENAMSADPREVGDCLDNPLPSDSEDYGVPPLVVPCDEPHWGEVVFVGALPEDSDAAYPSDDDLFGRADAACAEPFAAVIGLPVESSSIAMAHYVPSDLSWAEGDRNLLCIATDPAGQTTGSLAGSAR